MASTVEREVFLRERRKGIGGSDVAAIFGLDPYRTPEEVWLEKTGQVIPFDEPSGDKERGVRLEPVAAEIYAERTGKKLTRVSQTLVHPEYTWMRANIDRLIVGGGDHPSDYNQNEIGEIKCPSLGMFARLKREGLPFRWTLQAQHYLCVSGLARCVWIIFCADRWSLIEFVVERDELIIDRIVEKEREFWQYVVTMAPPPNIIADIVKDEIVIVGKVTKRSDEEFVAAMTHLKEARAVAKTGEELVEQAKARVLELAGEKPGIYEVAGVGRVNYAQRAGRQTFDHKTLAVVKPIDRAKLIQTVGENTYLDGRLDVIDLQYAAEKGDLDLDLSQFFTTGQPFMDFRFYSGKEEQ